jgi:hypothetical protein
MTFKRHSETNSEYISCALPRTFFIRSTKDIDFLVFGCIAYTYVIHFFNLCPSVYRNVSIEKKEVLCGIACFGCPWTGPLECTCPSSSLHQAKSVSAAITHWHSQPTYRRRASPQNDEVLNWTLGKVSDAVKFQDYFLIKNGATHWKKIRSQQCHLDYIFMNNFFFCMRHNRIQFLISKPKVIYRTPPILELLDKTFILITLCSTLPIAWAIFDMGDGSRSSSPLLSSGDCLPSHWSAFTFYRNACSFACPSSWTHVTTPKRLSEFSWNSMLGSFTYICRTVQILVKNGPE